MSENERLRATWARVVRGDAEGDAYHGPAIERILAGVDARRATARPIPASHSIAEIAFHVGAWRDYVLSALEQRRAMPLNEGWKRIESLRDAEWSAMREGLSASARAVEDAIARAAPAVLAENADRLLFLVHHDVAHAGQIGLLAKAT